MDVSYFNTGFLRQGDAALDRAYLGISGSGGLVPTGGLTGEVLTKDSNADFDMSWQPGGGGGSPNLDGGIPSSTYGAISPINGGTP